MARQNVFGLIGCQQFATGAENEVRRFIFCSVRGEILRGLLRDLFQDWSAIHSQLNAKGNDMTGAATARTRVSDDLTLTKAEIFAPSLLRAYR